MAAATATKEKNKAKKSAPTPPNKRNRVPTILQMEAVECGAAALAMILAYYGRIVALEELRVQCGVSRDGSKASNVLKAARKYGLKAKGQRFEKVESLFNLNFPVILFWNFNHFLVLEGFSKKGRAFLNDPAGGPRSVSMEEMDASFSGVVLSFEPGEDFQPGGEKPDMISALRRRLKGLEMALMFAILAGLFLVIPGLVTPTFQRVFIDEYLVGGRTYMVKKLLLGMGLTAFVQILLTYMQEYYLLRMETKISLTTSASFFNHVVRLPVPYFSQRYAGDIASRVLINNKVANLVSERLTGTMLDLVMVIFYAALLMVYDVTLTVVCIALSMINILVVKLAARRRTDSARRFEKEQGKVMGTAMNGLSMIETLKATGSENEFFGRWAGYQAKALVAQQELGVASQLVNAVPPLVDTVTTAVILLLGSLKVMGGEMTIGMLVAYQSLMSSFTRPLNTFVSFGGEMQELEADMNRLDDVLKHPQDPQYEQEERLEAELDDDATSVKLNGHVEFRDITFGYSPLAKPLIENFNLTLKPGQRVAFVGLSGSGKSTVAKVLSGLYRQWSGEIYFDGVPRSETPPSIIRNSLAVVDQEIFLFEGTVRENVSMWDKAIPTVAITKACTDAAIEHDIQSRLGKYDSKIEEGGGNFSGGQRQRLEIARALVGSPRILILDEATSALDPPTEAFVDDAIRRRGCTCVIVAHRLSTVRDADEILVLDRGKIVQRGTHDEMKDVPGAYAELIKH